MNLRRSLGVGAPLKVGVNCERRSDEREGGGAVLFAFPAAPAAEGTEGAAEFFKVS
jgi:hypothetical protein